MTLHIHVRDLVKKYALRRTDFHAGGQASGDALEKTAVDKVSLQISEGERVGIIGRNGAGKSTLLHMIAGLSTPTSGELDVSGSVTSIMTLCVGLREQATGRENIYIDGEVQGKTRAEIDAVLDQIIEFAEIGEFIDYPVRTYSTGMKSRLAFAMISCLEPEILIIDEALSAGDARFSAKATAKIREICAKGKIVIVVSHSMGAIQSICNRCIWMDGGRVVMDGAPSEVVSRYIDAVRADDEQRLLERFKAQALHPRTAPGWSVDCFQIEQGGNGERTLVEAGEPMAIIARITGPGYAAETEVSCSITRLDGTLIWTGVVAKTAQGSQGDIAFQLRMKRVVMGQGVYRLDLVVARHGTEQAAQSRIFEVYTQTPPSGGVPILLYPSQVSSRPVS
ncbi:ABC transporter ATP-binding protein [Bordetella parapertussis]|uniref:ABC transporter ATP-binding protein n=2 Tax=Bordetella parapertussis TaxID=519 RepID=K0MBS5_BORPB|nr:ABC transporter ATP-binding protein [Bordetella parapertussis]ABF72476.1 WbmM [Bordetella parapertussis]CCJ47464.1 ABC transporter ATP-binding protein [Bordetella parapertussis Bpp5]